MSMLRDKAQAVKPQAIKMSLVERAEAALASEERQGVAEACADPRLRGEIALRKAMEILAVAPEGARLVSPSTVEVEGLQFTAFYDAEQRFGGEVILRWTLRLLYPCPKCQKVQRMSEPIRTLADLARVLKASKSDVCWRCRS